MEIKLVKLYPVVTLVIYLGESGDWDGSLYLYDMFEEFIDNEDKKELEKFVTNYKVNLVQLDKIEDINIFKSDLRETIGMLQCKADEEKMKRYIEENEKVLSMLDLEASRVIEDVLKIGSLKKYASKKDGRMVVNVCKAFKDHEKSGEIKGDRKRLIDLIVKKIKKDKSIDVIAEELETDKIEIEAFYNIAVNSAPNYDVDEIYDKWKVNNNS